MDNNGFPVRALVSTSPVTKPPHRGLLEALSADFGPTRTLGEPFKSTLSPVHQSLEASRLTKIGQRVGSEKTIRFIQ